MASRYGPTGWSPMAEIGWSPIEEIEWSSTKEIRWSPSQEIGWSSHEEILHSRDSPSIRSLPTTTTTVGIRLELRTRCRDSNSGCCRHGFLGATRTGRKALARLPPIRHEYIVWIGIPVAAVILSNEIFSRRAAITRSRMLFGQALRRPETSFAYCSLICLSSLSICSWRSIRAEV